ncbi:MAG: hypothetical protein ACXWNR_09660, partial [Candidatus Limnocylindrales bacterium]
ADTYLRQYDASLGKVCEEIEATDAVSGKLYCTADESRLSLSDFTIADLSTVDYLHPSLTGQAKMAEAAWATDIWHAVPLAPPPAAFGPAGAGLAAIPPLALFGPALLLTRPRSTHRRRIRQD